MPKSKTPSARRARRLVRNFLRYAIVATATDLPEDVRKSAEAKAKKLESKIA